MSTRRTDIVPLLRIVGVVLVLAGELWILLPLTHAATFSPLDGVLQAANLAYAALFALSGFVMTRLLLPLVRVRRGLALTAGSRLASASVPVVLLVCGGVGLTSALDPKDTVSAEVTRRSIAHVLTFNWNNYIRGHALEVRLDLVPLWFFSVEAQLLLGLIVALLLFGRQRGLLTGIVVVALPASYIWGLHLYAELGWFQAGLRTDAHIDALLCGVLAALIASRARLSAATSSAVVGGGALVLVGLVLFASRMTLDQSFRGASTFTAVVVAAMVGAAASADGRGAFFDANDVPAVRDIGRSWAYLLAFGPPVFAAVSRHTVSWDGASRLLPALGLLALLVYVVDQVLRPLAGAAWQTARAARAHASALSESGGDREVADVDRGAGGQ